MARYTRSREIIDNDLWYYDIYPDDMTAVGANDPLKKMREDAVNRYIKSFDYNLHNFEKRQKIIRRIEKKYS